VPPSPYLSFNLHLDGMRETNDRVVDRVGHFDIIVKMIKMLKEKGYRVQTNTTVFRETSGQELEDMVKYLTSLGVDGMLSASTCISMGCARPTIAWSIGWGISTPS